MNDTAYSAFLGDQIRQFCLTAPMILELERKTGCGIGLICQRVIAREYTLNEVTETVRLALVGAGTDPQEAAAIVEVYLTPRPLVESYSLALSILEALMFGSALTKIKTRKATSRG